ncbi:MAG: amidase [Panacagrimonas sp.]|jgi:fatty acid amide hydrolase 2|nr:amidase [Panacagrimonas sp.]MCC2655838.1 amidase [Panacagrimonas sp.]
MNPLLASASEMSRALRARDVTSRALVDAHIARVVAVNRRINAMVQFRFDEARREADAADELLRTTLDPSRLPPLHGVPCTLKENFAFEGFPQVSGMVSRRAAIAQADAPTVARLRAAGAIVLGFSNTPELCMWMETHNHVYGRTSNPYDAGRIAGGSSGGEGALIGAGASPFGLGADVGGSIRFPAFFNGVFGHKPTPGIVPNTGQYPEPKGAMNHNCVTGPIARRAEDLWPLLRILSGPDGVDPLCTAGALRGDPAEVKLEHLRIVAIRDDGRRRVAADLSGAQLRAAHFLGARSRGLSWIQPRALRHAFDIWAALMQQAEPEPFAVQLGDGRRISTLRELGRWAIRRTPHTLPALVLALLESLPVPRARHLELGKALRTELLSVLGDDAVLLYPPYTRVAPRHNLPMLTPFDFAYCGLFNVLGFPSTQVPLGLNARGLPLGVQVIAAPGGDARTIAVAQALEREFGGWVMPPR